MQKRIDVLVVVETWMKTDPPKISGMTIASWTNRKPTYKNGHGGGVAIYVNDKHLSYSKENLAATPDEGVDMCCIRIYNNNSAAATKYGFSSIFICGAYIPPELTGSEWWRCIPPNVDCIVCADVNCCGSWSSFGTPHQHGHAIDTWLISSNMM